MARRKAAPPAPKPAKIVTSYTDRVVLEQGDEPLRPSDLRALVDAVEHEIFLDNELSEVTLTGGTGVYDVITGVYKTSPSAITVTQVTKNEETL